MLIRKSFIRVKLLFGLGNMPTVTTHIHLQICICTQIRTRNLNRNKG